MLSPCKTCRYFLLGEGDDVGILKGECRRDTPRFAISSGFTTGFWPDVNGEAPGCGEHKPVLQPAGPRREDDPDWRPKTPGFKYYEPPK